MHYQARRARRGGPAEYRCTPERYDGDRSAPFAHPCNVVGHQRPLRGNSRRLYVQEGMPTASDARRRERVFYQMSVYHPASARGSPVGRPRLHMNGRAQRGSSDSRPKGRTIGHEASVGDRRTRLSELRPSRLLAAGFEGPRVSARAEPPLMGSPGTYAIVDLRRMSMLVACGFRPPPAPQGLLHRAGKYGPRPKKRCWQTASSSARIQNSTAARRGC